MPLLTFRVKKEHLLSKRKKKTIRKNAQRWFRMATNAKKKGSKLLHIWWKNPRTKRYTPDCYKMGIARWTGYYGVHGYDMDDHLAFEDGFDNVNQLRQALGRENKMTPEEVMEHLWVVIEFEWEEGPFTQEESAMWIPKERWDRARKDMKAMFEGKDPEKHGFTKEKDGSYSKGYY